MEPMRECVWILVLALLSVLTLTFITNTHGSRYSYSPPYSASIQAHPHANPFDAMLVQPPANGRFTPPKARQFEAMSMPEAMRVLHAQDEAHLNRQYENPLFAERYTHSYAPPQQQRNARAAAAQGNSYAHGQHQWQAPLRSPSAMPPPDALRVLHAQDQVSNVLAMTLCSSA